MDNYLRGSVMKDKHLQTASNRRPPRDVPLHVLHVRTWLLASSLLVSPPLV
jgi:hypothetical protein